MRRNYPKLSGTVFTREFCEICKTPVKMEPLRGIADCQCPVCHTMYIPAAEPQYRKRRRDRKFKI